MTLARTHEVTGAEVLELLRAHGPSPAPRLSTLLQQQGRDITAAQLQPVLDGGDIITVRRRPRHWNDTGRGFVEYALAGTR